jgi:ribose/xylose/arabinose/galactoside ABC-type transport system permease subunit
MNSARPNVEDRPRRLKRIVFGITTGSPSTFLERRGVYVALAIVVLISALLSPAFYKFSNILNVLRAAAVLGIVSIGQTIVILGGGIDLSVGAVMGTVAIFISEFTGGSDDYVAIAIPGCLLIGVIVGWLNGLLTTKRNIPPFVATLGMLIFVEGVRFAYTRGVISGRPAPFVRVLASIIGPIPIPVVIVVISALLIGIMLKKTPFGRQLFAVGGNRETARFSGINVERVTIITYVLCGLFAAVAGLLLSGYIGYGDRYLGRGFDLDSIAAVVVGGTSFAGGRGGIGGTIAGVLLLTALFNIVLILNLQVHYQLILKGVVMIGAVMVYSMQVRLKE